MRAVADWHSPERRARSDAPYQFAQVLVKTLILGYGNQSRRDDGVGWFVLEQLAALNLPDVELETSHQLEVEASETISRFDAVIFVDAAIPEAPEAGPTLRRHAQLPKPRRRPLPDAGRRAVAVQNALPAGAKSRPVQHPRPRFQFWHDPVAGSRASRARGGEANRRLVRSGNILTEGNERRSTNPLKSRLRFVGFCILVDAIGRGAYGGDMKAEKGEMCPACQAHNVDFPMVVLIPVRTTIRMLPLIGLLMFLFFNGIFLAGAVIDLFTEPKSLDKAHLLVIPVALVPGLVFFRLGRQLFKKGYVDNEEAGIFSKVGFSAWVVFLLALSSFAGGACMMKSLTSGELSHQQPQVRLDRPVSQTTGLNGAGSPVPGCAPVRTGAAAPSHLLQLTEVIRHCQRQDRVHW